MGRKMALKFVLTGFIVFISFGLNAQGLAQSYSSIFMDSFTSYGSYIWQEITFQTPVWYVN